MVARTFTSMPARTASATPVVATGVFPCAFGFFAYRFYFSASG